MMNSPVVAKQHSYNNLQILHWLPFCWSLQDGDTVDVNYEWVIESFQKTIHD